MWEIGVGMQQRCIAISFPSSSIFRQHGFCTHHLTKFLSACMEKSITLQRTNKGAEGDKEECSQFNLLCYLFLQLCTVLGHLAAVFCVLFDHTGRCIVTVSKLCSWVASAELMYLQTKKNFVKCIWRRVRMMTCWRCGPAGPASSWPHCEVTLRKWPISLLALTIPW